MTPGKRNIEGITFQVLRTAQWASWIHIAPSTTSPNAVRITAEPLGGDVQVEGTGPLIVQQFKTRGGDRTWSLREVVDEVLPDLYLAVPKSLDRPVRYQFVTNGRMGSWREAQTFFASLADRPIPGSPLARLDDETLVRFFGKGRCTRRELFAEICDAVRAHGEVKKLKDTVLQTRKKVWHLLGRFSFDRTLGVEESRAALREMLRVFANSDEEAEKLVHEATGRVLNFSRKPDSTFTPQQLLLCIGPDRRRPSIGPRRTYVPTRFIRYPIPRGSPGFSATASVDAVSACGCSSASPICRSGTGATSGSSTYFRLATPPHFAAARCASRGPIRPSRCRRSERSRASIAALHSTPRQTCSAPVSEAGKPRSKC